jgi:hypothetical protein
MAYSLARKIAKIIKDDHGLDVSVSEELVVSYGAFSESLKGTTITRERLAELAARIRLASHG